MIESLAPYVGAAVALASLAYTIWVHRSAAAAASVARLETRIEGKADQAAAAALHNEIATIVGKVDHSEHRLTLVEERVRHLPDKDTTHDIQVAIAKLSGQIDVLTERFKPVAAMSQRVQDILLERERV